MSNENKEITLRPAQGLQIQSVDELARVAAMMASSGFFQDAKEAAQAGVKIMAGQGWGINPFDAMTGIHIIKGRPSVGANLMAAKVKSSGKYDYRVRTMSAELCEIEFFQGGESLGVSSFSLAEARKAGTQNLDKFARNMLFARAMSNGVRWYCPDVFMTAVYTPEELGADVDNEGNVVEVVSRPAPVERQLDAAPAVKAEPSPAPASKVGAPIPEDDEPVDVEALADQAPWEGDTLFPETESEPLITGAQLKALHTRLTKLGFNGTKEEKERARVFIGWLVKRDLGSSKELTKSEAHSILEHKDDELERRLDDFNAEQQMGEQA